MSQQSEIPQEESQQPTLQAQSEPVEIEQEQEADEPQKAVEALNEEISRLNDLLNQSKNDLLRAYADTDNTRKRLQREADQAKKYSFQSAAQKLLPIVDNMEASLAHVPEEEGNIKSFVDGFAMINNQIKQILEAEGVSEIDALGKPFDANYMQALMTEPATDTEPGVVVEVLQKGYMLKDRLLRPALVKVSE